MLRRRDARPTPGMRYEPDSSGPRCTSVLDMRSSIAAGTSRGAARLTRPDIPHMAWRSSRQSGSTAGGGPLRARRWAPRLWMGCSMRSWWQLLRRHGFAVDARYLYFAAVDTVVSIVNSALAAIAHALYARRVSETEPPEIIFIVGHWRSGTTLLHELLCLDPRHVSPTTYECLAPHHFLLTESVLPRLLKFLMPERRPVDDMK